MFVLSGTAGASTSPYDLSQNTSAIEAAESLEGNYLAAIVAGAAHDTSAAAAYYAEALRDDPGNPELLQRGFITFLASGAMKDAFLAAQIMLRQDPNNGLAHLALGVRDIKIRHYRAARAHLSHDGHGRAPDITTTLLKAWAWEGSGATNKALRTVDSLKSEKAFDLFRDYHAGLIASVAGYHREAQKRLSSAYKAEPNTLRVVDAYGRFESSRGNNKAALEAYESLAKLAPNLATVKSAIASLKAGKRLDLLVRNAQEGASEALYGLGAAGGQQGDDLASMIYLRLALYLDPHNDMALVALAEFQEQSKQRDAAVDLLDQVPATSPLKKSASIKAALDLEIAGHAADAEQRIKDLAAQYPEDPDVLTAQANIFEARKKFAEAAATYTRVIGLIGTPGPADWQVFYRRGVAYDQAKDWPKAEADLKKALELVPEKQTQGRAVILNYLGYSWIDRGLHLEKGLEMVKQAVSLRPRDAYIIDSLGWAYYKLGKYEDAVRELEKSIDIKPSEWTTNDHLGDAYWRVGRKLEATFQWNHARDLNPDPDALKKILEKIKNGLPEPAKPAAAEVNKPVPGKKDGG